MDTSQLDAATRYSGRDVTIDSIALKIGSNSWPIEKLKKINYGESPGKLPPKNFLIGGAVALVVAYFVGGFLGFLFFAAGVGVNVWWYRNQPRTAYVSFDIDSLSVTAGNWANPDALLFAGDVAKWIINAQRGIEVRRLLFSEERPFRKFGPLVEEKLVRLQEDSSFASPEERNAFFLAMPDVIWDQDDLSDEAKHLACDLSSELFTIGEQKRRLGLIGEINAARNTGSSNRASIDSQSAYEKGVALLESDNSKDREEGFELLKKAVELDPHNTPALVEIGKRAFLVSLNMHHEGDINGATEYQNRAETVLSAAVYFDSVNQEARRLLCSARFNCGKWHSEAGRLTEAFDSFRNALVANPESLHALAMFELVGSQTNRMSEVGNVLVALSSNSPPFDANIEIGSRAAELLEIAKESGRNEDWSSTFERSVESLDIEPSVSAWLCLKIAANKLGRETELADIKVRLLTRDVNGAE